MKGNRVLSNQEGLHCELDETACKTLRQVNICCNKYYRLIDNQKDPIKY